MKTVSKNKLKKLRRDYNPIPYYHYLLALFMYVENEYEFIREINYSLLNRKRNLTTDLVRYAKMKDMEIGERLEMYLTSIVNGLANESSKGFEYTKREIAQMEKGEKRQLK